MIPELLEIANVGSVTDARLDAVVTRQGWLQRWLTNVRTVQGLTTAKGCWWQGSRTYQEERLYVKSTFFV